MTNYTKQNLLIKENLNQLKSIYYSKIRFKKGELIGEGSYGKVYQGFDEQQGKLIAIKELDLRRVSSKNLKVCKYNIYPNYITGNKFN
jgi:serine/threonine protein kinase